MLECCLAMKLQKCPVDYNNFSFSWRWGNNVWIFFWLNYSFKKWTAVPANFSPLMNLHSALRHVAKPRRDLPLQLSVIGPVCLIFSSLSGRRWTLIVSPPSTLFLFYLDYHTLSLRASLPLLRSCLCFWFKHAAGGCGWRLTLRGISLTQGELKVKHTHDQNHRMTLKWWNITNAGMEATRDKLCSLSSVSIL